MSRLWKRLRDEERGQNVSEFALILVLVGLLAASAAASFGTTVSGTCSTVNAAITHASSAGSNGSSSSDEGSSAIDEFGTSATSSSNRGSSSGRRSGNSNRHGQGHGGGLALGRQ